MRRNSENARSALVCIASRGDLIHVTRMYAVRVRSLRLGCDSETETCHVVGGKVGSRGNRVVFDDNAGTKLLLYYSRIPYNAPPL